LSGDRSKNRFEIFFVCVWCLVDKIHYRLSIFQTGFVLNLSMAGNESPNENLVLKYLQRELPNGTSTPLELIARFIKEMRIWDDSSRRRLPKTKMQYNERIMRIANMVKYRQAPGTKACLNLARLKAGRRNELDLHLSKLGEHMKEAYAWIKEQEAVDREDKAYNVDHRVLDNLHKIEKSTCCIPRESKWFRTRVLYMMTTQSGQKRIPVWVYADGFELDGIRYPTVEKTLDAAGIRPPVFVYHMGYMSS
jgi:hypothetical protein